MVTYYNRKDLVSFGNYLLSEKRKANKQSSYGVLSEESQKGTPFEEFEKEVSHADVQNWIDSIEPSSN